MAIKDYQEKFIKKYNRQGGKCEVCDKPLQDGIAQMAHRIPKKKYLIKKYGLDAIDHEHNLSLVCSLRCNASVLVEYKPAEIEKILKKIKKTQ